MNIESQVTSLELSKRLKELGVKQESLFYWRDNDGFDNCAEEDFSIVSHINPAITTWYASAFTASELLELIPAAIHGNPIQVLKTWFSDKYRTYISNGSVVKMEEHTLCDSLAKMLIYLIENKLMEIK